MNPDATCDWNSPHRPGPDSGSPVGPRTVVPPRHAAHVRGDRHAVRGQESVRHCPVGPGLQPPRPPLRVRPTAGRRHLPYPVRHLEHFQGGLELVGVGDRGSGDHGLALAARHRQEVDARELMSLAAAESLAVEVGDPPGGVVEPGRPNAGGEGGLESGHAELGEHGVESAAPLERTDRGCRCRLHSAGRVRSRRGRRWALRAPSDGQPTDTESRHRRRVRPGFFPRPNGPPTGSPRHAGRGTGAPSDGGSGPPPG